MYLNFTLFNPKLPPLRVGVTKFTTSGLLPLHMLHTKFGKDWPSSFWGEDVTDNRRWGTQTHSNNYIYQFERIFLLLASICNPYTLHRLKYPVFPLMVIWKLNYPCTTCLVPIYQIFVWKLTNRHRSGSSILSLFKQNWKSL